MARKEGVVVLPLGSRVRERAGDRPAVFPPAISHRRFPLGDSGSTAKWTEVLRPGL